MTIVLIVVGASAGLVLAVALAALALKVTGLIRFLPDRLDGLSGVSKRSTPGP